MFACVAGLIAKTALAGVVKAERPRAGGPPSGPSWKDIGGAETGEFDTD